MSRLNAAGLRALLTATGCLIALVIWPTHSSAQIFRRWNTESTSQSDRGSGLMNLFQGSSKPAIPVKYTKPPDQMTLIADINARATRIKQIGADVTVKVHQPGTPRISGSLQVEFPSRMRLKAGVGGMSEMGIDAGSNEGGFWFWSKVPLPGQGPAFLFSSHEAFKNSPLKRQLPLEPRWLINALGIVELDPGERHLGPDRTETGHLVLTTPRSQTSQMTRRMLINPSNGLVEQIAIYDEQDKLLAYSNARDFEYNEKYNISVPGQIELHVTQPDGSDLSITIELNSYSFNSLFGDPQKMWQMPWPDNVDKYDLGNQPRR